jgi:hypothetical protein
MDCMWRRNIGIERPYGRSAIIRSTPPVLQACEETPIIHPNPTYNFVQCQS